MRSMIVDLYVDLKLEMIPWSKGCNLDVQLADELNIHKNRCIFVDMHRKVVDKKDDFAVLLFKSLVDFN